LERGSARLENPGEPIVLLVGDASLRLERGVVVAEREAPPSPAVSWISAAHAETPLPWRVVVLEGSALLTLGEGNHALRAGQEFSPVSGLRPATPLSWSGEEGWREVPGLPVRISEGVRPLGEVPEGDYAWEALFRREAGTGMSVLLRLEDRGVSFPLGGALLRAGDSLVRVRVTVRRGWVRIEAGGERVFSARIAEALRRLPPAAPACGLQCWGGAADIHRARWRRGEEVP
jgi:hypothetical protein